MEAGDVLEMTGVEEETGRDEQDDQAAGASYRGGDGEAAGKGGEDDIGGWAEAQQGGAVLGVNRPICLDVGRANLGESACNLGNRQARGALHYM